MLVSNSLRVAARHLNIGTSERMPSNERSSLGIKLVSLSWHYENEDMPVNMVSEIGQTSRTSIVASSRTDTESCYCSTRFFDLILEPSLYSVKIREQ